MITSMNMLLLAIFAAALASTFVLSTNLGNASIINLNPQEPDRDGDQPLELSPIPKPSDAELLQLSEEGKEANERIISVMNQMSMVIQICTSEINLQRNWALIVTCKVLMEDFADTLDQFNEANINRTLSIILGSVP